MMKNILFIFIILSMVFVCNAYAEKITLPNGQVLNIDNLSETEITQAIKTAKKSMNSEFVIKTVSGLNPTELDNWRKLITGTIKDVCNDLSITVNDFVKTPVGIGIAVLIAYKIAGKDLLENAFDIIIMVPLWFLVSIVCLYMAWYFFSMKTVYNEFYKDNVLEEKKPERIERFNWEYRANKEGFAWTLGITWIVTTILTLFIILA